MRLLYNFFLLLLLPFLYVGFLFHPRGRIRIKERFGIHRHNLESIKVVAHGASVGEILSMIPILDALKVSKDDILITGTSVTGLFEAQKRGYYKNLLLPFDVSYFYRKAFIQCRPSLCLISESDIWSEMIYFFSKRSKVVFVNGRFRHSLSKNISPLYRSALKYISLFCVENESSKDSLSTLNVPIEKICVTGNAKYDVSPLETSIDERSIIAKKEPLITLGSIRPKELPLFSKILNSERNFRVVIAPRHLEYLHEYMSFLQPFGFGLWSKRDDAQILLLDTFGELKNFYAQSDLIVVGGSFVPGVGGHNPLEGAPTKTPTCIGMYAYKVQDIVDDLLERGGIQVIQSNEDEIEKVIVELIENEQKRHSLGQRLHDYWKSIAGAGSKQAKILTKLIEET